MLGSTRTELTSSAQAEDFSLTDAAMRSAHSRSDRRRTPTRDRGVSEGESRARRRPIIYFLIASDHRYSGPVMKIAERRAALGKGPVYLYYFRWETPVEGGRLKSPHTIEIPFAFDNIKAATR